VPAQHVKSEKKTTENLVYEKKYGYIPKETPVERAVLHVLFPLEVYWRNVTIKVKIGEKIVNKEGQVYPSFSDVVFPADYRIEMVSEKKFLISHARGYVTCPICGRNIMAKLENYEYETKNEIEKFTSEVAYEIVIMALAKELAARLKRHIEAVHGYNFKKSGRETVMITRYVGRGQEVVIQAPITTYKCPYDTKGGIYGVYGILDHLVTHHENTAKAKDVIAYLDNLVETTRKVLGLGKDKVPLIGAYRNTFYYVLDRRGAGRKTYRVIDWVWFKPWLYMKAVETASSVNLIVTASIPRPMRMIYHYPIFRYVPHVLAYKINPGYYMRFMERVKRRLRSRGYSTENLEKMVELVTGSLAYTKITPRSAFTIDLDTLENLRQAIEDVGETARVFLSKRVV
jgi:hypothetical protein